MPNGLSQSVPLKQSGVPSGVPGEKAGDVCFTPKIDVAMVNIPKLDFSSVSRGRVKDKIQFFNDLAMSEKVGIEKSLKDWGKKPHNATTGCVQTVHATQAKRDLAEECVPTELEQPGVQVRQQEDRLVWDGGNPRKGKECVSNLVPVERMVVIESLDGKETMQPTQEVDDIVDPDKNIAMAGPTGEVFNIDVVPDDQAVSVVREKELDRLYKAYVAGITALLEYVVKPTKVDHEDLDKSDIDSVVTSGTNDVGSSFEELSDTMPYFHNMGIDDSNNVSGYGQDHLPMVTSELTTEEDVVIAVNQEDR